MTPDHSIETASRIEPEGRRKKILMSAYACEPGRGSEPEVGWQWSLQMARFYDVTVLTRSNNRQVIEAELAKMGDVPKPSFIYFDLPGWVLRFKKRFNLHKPYYVLWQRQARRHVAELLAKEHFDLLHHVTFAAFRSVTAIWGHGVRSVWGPVGGMESVPMRLLPWRHPRSLIEEIVRNLDNLLESAALGLLRERALRSTLVLASTKQMEKAFADLGIEAELMPSIALHANTISAPVRPVWEGPVRLLYVGNLISLKGLDLAIQALKESGADARLTLIGGGPLRKSLEVLAARLGLADRVEFRGRLPRAEVLATYAEHDLFVFPSLHDTGGFAVIEAMASAMPVVCLAVGGPEMAVLEGCGTCVPLGSRKNVIAGLAEAFRHYDRDRSLLVKEGHRARQIVETLYDWEKKGQAMNALYRQVFLTPENKLKEPTANRPKTNHENHPD